MAHISRLGFWRHLRAEPNQYILHYRRGKLVRSGVGQAYWFMPLSAAVAQLPVEDIETTFLLGERSADFQDITVQITLTYRVVDPQKAAQRINFSLSLNSGAWLEQPLQRLANLWAHWSRHVVRSQLITMPVREIVRAGAAETLAALEQELSTAPEIEEIGIDMVSVQVDKISPTSELEKALQTPTREAIQQKADEAAFQRRALAVENERAIKENELATEIELARRQEHLIQQQGDNQMLADKMDADRQRMSVKAEAERGEIAAQGQANATLLRAEANADARRQMLQVETDAEARRVELWKDASPAVTFGLAMQRFAEKVDSIQHLNLTPDLLGGILQRVLLDEKGPAE